MSLLAENFRKRVMDMKDYKMKVETEYPVSYPTGFIGFDFLNGSVVHVKTKDKDFKYYSVGITDGSMVMIIGRSGCGKTTFSIQAASNIIRPFKTSCIFHDDIEGGITENRKEILAQMSGDELEERYISRNTGITCENFYERIKVISDLKLKDRESFSYDTGLFDSRGNRIYKLEPTVYILDSLALLTPEKFSEEEELSGQMSTTATAKSNAQIFRRTVPLLKSSNIILFIINHINQKVEINKFAATKLSVSYLKQGETLPGGNTPIYLSNLMIRLDDATKFKEDEGFGIPGSEVVITLLKSRNARAGKTVSLAFNTERGFDPDYSILMLLKEYGCITGGGRSFKIKGYDDMPFSQKQFKEKLNTNKEFANAVSNALHGLTKDLIIDTDLENIDSNIGYNIALDVIESLNTDMHSQVI